MKITVIYPAYRSTPPLPQLSFTVEVDDNLNAEQALERAWRLANLVNDDDVARFQEYAKQANVPGIRSSMVGDIYVLQNRYFQVDPIGFAPLTAEQAEQCLALARC